MSNSPEQVLRVNVRQVEYSINIEDINVQLYQARLHMTRTEAVMVPANPNLLHFEGGARAVSVLAGPELEREIQSRFPRPLPMGEAVATLAHNMKNKYILHCVIPHYTAEMPERNIRKALMDSIGLAFALCEELEVSSVSMPLFGHDCRQIPVKIFAETLSQAMEQFLTDHEENRTLSFIHIVDLDLQALEKLKNLLSWTFKIHILRARHDERADFSVTPTRRLTATSSAVIVVVSKQQFDLIRERVMRVYSNEYKVRTVGANSIFLTDLRPREQRLVKDVAYVKAPRNVQMLHVFKRALFTELKALLVCGRRNISLVVEKDALFMENTSVSSGLLAPNKVYAAMDGAGAGFKQDMPPRGGYGPINWMKQQTKKGMSGFGMFATYVGFTTVGMVAWYFQAQYWKNNRREMIDARIAVEPLVMAEIDRLYLKRLRANREEENELMKDVPGWKTGTLYGQPIYNNIRNRFIEPSHKEFLAHISWNQMFDILYERRKH